jgi:hypothetical protein
MAANEILYLDFPNRFFNGRKLVELTAEDEALWRIAFDGVQEVANEAGQEAKQATAETIAKDLLHFVQVYDATDFFAEVLVPMLLTNADKWDEWAKASRAIKKRLKRLVHPIVNAVKNVRAEKGNNLAPPSVSQLKDSSGSPTDDCETGTRHLSRDPKVSITESTTTVTGSSTRAVSSPESLWSRGCWSIPTGPPGVHTGVWRHVITAPATDADSECNNDDFGLLERCTVDALVEEPNDSSSRPASSASVA